jgi:hypothetical protein
MHCSLLGFEHQAICRSSFFCGFGDMKSEIDDGREVEMRGKYLYAYERISMVRTYFIASFENVGGLIMCWT